MPVFMESSPVDHPCNAKQGFDKTSKTHDKDAGGKGWDFMSAMSTMETMPSITDMPKLSDIPTTSSLGDAHLWDERDSSFHGTDDMNEIDAYGNFLASERSSDEGRRCDISYTDTYDNLLSDPLRSGLNDPLFSELPAEPIVPNKCSFPEALNQDNKVGKVRKGILQFGTRSSDDGKQGNKVLFCHRLLKMTKTKQVEEEDSEMKFLAKLSIMTQIAQHADEVQKSFTPKAKGFGRQFSAGPSFGRQFSASSDDLDFDYCFGRQVTAPLSSHSTSHISKHGPVGLAVLDEAVEIDACAESLGHALWNMSGHVDEARDSFTHKSKGFGRQVSAGPKFGRQFSAPANGVNFNHGFGRQVTAPLPSHSRSPALKHVSVDIAALDEAVQMDECAEPPGRDLQKLAQPSDQARDLSMSDSKLVGRQVSAGPRFGRRISAPADDLNFDQLDGFSRQIVAPLPSQPKSLRRFSSAC